MSCHSGQKAKGGLRLDRFDLVMKGGNGGAAIIPGDTAKSLLTRYIDLPEDDEKHMPPKGKTQVTDDERAILDWWSKRARRKPGQSATSPFRRTCNWPWNAPFPKPSA